MLAQDDYTFLLEKSDATKPLLIELTDRIINQQQEQVIFKVTVKSPEKLPVCGKQETILNVDAKAFRKCTKACFTVFPCPIFPKELAEPKDASLDDVSYFFALCIKYITTVPQLRETSFLRNLLCKSATLCIQEFETVIKQDKQAKISNTAKLVTNTAVNQTVDGFKQFGDSMKQLFNLKKQKPDDDVTPSPNSDDGKQQENAYKDLENELAVTDKILKQQIQFSNCKKNHIEELLRQQHQFAVSQAEVLSKNNKIQNYQLNLMVFPLTEDSMESSQNIIVRFLQYRQIPILQVAQNISNGIKQLIDQANTFAVQEQKLMKKLDKGANQQAQMDLDKVQAQKKQINDVIQNSIKSFQDFVQSELKQNNVTMFLKLVNNCEEKAVRYKRAVQAVESGNDVSVGLNHGCFQVTLK